MHELWTQSTQVQVQILPSPSSRQIFFIWKCWWYEVANLSLNNAESLWASNMIMLIFILESIRTTINDHSSHNSIEFLKLCKCYDDSHCWKSLWSYLLLSSFMLPIWLSFSYTELLILCYLIFKASAVLEQYDTGS